MIRDAIFKIITKKRFKSYKNSLPKESSLIKPKMEYDFLKDAVYWEDEGLMEKCPSFVGVFGLVIS